MYQFKKIYVGKIICTSLLILLYFLAPVCAHLEKQKPTPKREIAQLAGIKETIILEEGLIGGVPLNEIEQTFQELKEGKTARKKKKDLEEQYFELLSSKERKERKKKIKKEDNVTLRKTLREGLEGNMTMREILKQDEENRQLRQQKREQDYVRWWNEASVNLNPKTSTIVERMQWRQFLEETEREAREERRAIIEAKIESDRNVRIKAKKKEGNSSNIGGSLFLFGLWHIFFLFMIK